MTAKSCFYLHPPVGLVEEVEVLGAPDLGKDLSAFVA